MGVQQMLADVVAACDVDARPQLLNNVILTGGSTLMPDFADRINNELARMMPSVFIRTIFYCDSISHGVF